MAGIFYAACPGSFVLLPGLKPIGLGATPTDLFMTHFCNQDLSTVDCNGNVIFVATIPGIPPPTCLERYVAIAPLVSMNAGFAPRDIFVTQGNEIWQVRPPNAPVLYATLPNCGNDHTGITFDHVGTSGFGYNMIVTCFDGGVWKILGDGPPATVMPIGNVGEDIEGPAVAPASFGPLAGQILACDDLDGNVFAITSTGVVTNATTVYGIGNFGAESIQVIPDNPCTYCGSYIYADSYSYSDGHSYCYCYSNGNVYANTNSDSDSVGSGESDHADRNDL